jgi:hypothetical protein
VISAPEQRRFGGDCCGVQILFWLSDDQLPGRTTVEDYLSMLEAEEQGLSDPALRARDRLVEALPNGNLALAG